MKSAAEYASAIQSLIPTAAIILGGLWALQRFWRERESVPRLQLDIMAEVVLETANTNIVAITAFIENKGKVRHEIRKFDLHLATLLSANVRDLQQFVPVDLQHGKASGSLMPKESKYSFIEPGIRSKYFALMTVPAGVDLIYVYTRFDYAGKEYEEAACCISGHSKAAARMDGRNASK